jgi:ribosomal protein L11 methyltransferase
LGFGEHATTRLAARAVERLCREAPGAGVLDVGTGGGLLAIVADRAGAGEVRGLDIDPDAVEVARRNAARNRARRCSFDTAPLGRDEGRYDVVVANIDARTVIGFAEPIAAMLARSGVVVLTGFLVEDEPEVLDAYRRRGLRLAGRDVEGDWLLLELRA